MDSEISSNTTSSNRELKIKVKFLCFIPTSVRIIHDNNWGEGSPLTHVGNGVFEYTYTSSTENVLMNMAFSSSGTKEELWICTSRGIGNSNVYINDVLMTNEYLVDNNCSGSNISLAFNDNGSFSPGPGILLTIVNVPPEVAHPVHYLHPYHNPPPFGSKKFDGWLAAIHDNKYTNEESSIEIEYFRIGVNRYGVDEVLVWDQYNSIDPVVTEIGGGV